MEFDEDGNELDPDLLMDMPSQGDNGLGGLGGNFENELQDLSLEEQLQQGSTDHALATRRPSNHILEPSRHSLAFELASALDPASSSGSLLAELGIEEEPEESFDGTQDSLEDSQIMQDAQSGQTERQTCVANDRTPVRKAKSRASYASLRASPDSRAIRASPPSLHATSSEKQREDEDSAQAAQFQADNASLQSCISTANNFLEHIGEHSASADGSASQPLYQDRQTFIEKLATTLIKALYELAKKREDEIRELKEVEKMLADQDPAWQSILAELDPIPAFPTASTSASIPSSKNRLATLAEEEEEPSARPAEIWTSQPISGELATLRHWTDLYITSFGAVAEHTQVSKATNTDASRKFKSLESAVGRLRSETESVERSQAYIRNWEAEETREAQNSGLRHTALPGLSGPRTRKTSNNSSKSVSSNGSQISTGRYSAQVRGEMKAAMNLLETSHERAKLLLSPL